MSIAPRTLVALDGVRLYHLVGPHQLPLHPEPGKLELLQSEPSALEGRKTSSLFVRMDKLVFPLNAQGANTVKGAQTPFFTHADHTDTLLFPAPLALLDALPDNATAPVASKSGQGIAKDLQKYAAGFIRIQLSPTTSREDRDRLEDVLIRLGLLETGVVAGADEVARSLSESWSALASRLTATTATHTSDAPATDAPVSVPASTKSAADTVQGGTARLATFAGEAQQAITGAAVAIGSAATSLVAPADTSEGKESKEAIKARAAEATETKDLAADSIAEDPTLTDKAREAASRTGQAASVLGSGIADGTTSLASAVSDSTSRYTEHHYGTEAKDLGSSVARSGGNVATTAGNAVLGTSVVGHAAAATYGATSVDPKGERETDEDIDADGMQSVQL
ncbi:uncharacterized protein L969DRAFT_617555 [Mixia osmundae IAM 14324]|uniref:Senescence domain-containing protein n=1 Tax=Mixia osmundae (strain CBS 9802 / IAM 14324 / JCM 22182 / KY 12970) TaxID=764103 RepID=G7E5F1_MIXOS|nr:uncharacterized protein L969DRAFT_617555 [Mixia osmundae IAM 14324]KEI40788.1 hypothetical protein L969DRAFT_617555 [Mixia osmundae IAM 14324]GAA98061.1 hypothetical protein E5Q_04742 [Mixia osmundae IAM 14324]